MIPKKNPQTLTLVAFLVILTIIGGTALVANPHQVWAHGKATIRLASGSLVFGGKITIEGENFEEKDEVTLRLLGLAGEFLLGTVTTDAEGRFRYEGDLPLTAHPGNYQVLARSKDATASANTRILASLDAAQALEHTTGLGFHRGASPGTMAALAAVIALLAVTGFALAFLPPSRRFSWRR
jgi:hypothetical protein